MKRILLMVARLFYIVPYHLFIIWWYGAKKDYKNGYRVTRRATKQANRAGRVTIEAHGLENIPDKEGFVFYPNHQGLFDVLVFLDSCPVPFGFVIKKEASRIILLKQVISALGSYSMDRKDLKQSMEVINKVSDEVRNGRNFLIFPEGTRSKKGNQLNDFKGGSFKIVKKAKASIVPCALIDSFVPFDKSSIEKVTVKILYLPAIPYEEFEKMSTNEIAKEVHDRIQNAIDSFLLKEEGN